MRISQVISMLVILTTLVLASIAFANSPKLINYQGLLSDTGGDLVADATYSVLFTIYDDPAQLSSVWTETQDITTTNGLFAVLLGSINPIEDTVFNTSPRYLGIKIGTDPELTPLTLLVTVPYSFRVSTIDGATGGNITSKVSIGTNHTNTGAAAFVAGYNNVVSEEYATVAGGFFNSASDTAATSSGGYHNLSSGAYSSIGGGQWNTASDHSTHVGGGGFNRASDTAATVGGGRSNYARGKYSVIAGGGGENIADSNSASGDWSTISGGAGNIATNSMTTVSGGGQNKSEGTAATVGGGRYCYARGSFSVISGGGGNSIIDSNLAQGSYSAIGGGTRNVTSGIFATIPGGNSNTALGSYSFAAGRRAKANHTGSFVWADQNNSDFLSSNTGQFSIRASGGTRIYSNSILTSGVILNPGASSWTSVCDSTLKRNIREVDYDEVLEKISELPISQWSYEAQDESIEHIGPMAQDFYNLFGLGEDDKHINTLDPDGIALAAIKALNDQNENLNEQNEAMRQMIEELQERLTALENSDH